MLFFAILRYRDGREASGVIQASGEMTDSSVSEKQPVLKPCTNELQFEFYK